MLDRGTATYASGRPRSFNPPWAAATIVGSLSRVWGHEARNAVKTLGQFLRENYGAQDVDLENAATKLLTGLKSTQFRFNGGLGLQAIAFLRADIYPLLRFDDKDKHRSSEYAIAWAPSELYRLIQARLPSGTTVDDIMDPDKMRQSTAPFAYVVQRTFLRPREVIQYLNEAKRRGNQDAEFISKDAIKDAELTYSRWKVDDLKQEYSKAIPEFTDCLEALRQGVHRYESLGELEAWVAQKQPRLAAVGGGRWIVDQLFDTSAIGVRPKKSGSIKYKSEDSELELPLEGAPYVHPGLRLGLNVTEKRTGADDDDEDTQPLF